MLVGNNLLHYLLSLAQQVCCNGIVSVYLFVKFDKNVETFECSLVGKTITPIKGFIIIVTQELRFIAICGLEELKSDIIKSLCSTAC